MLKSILPKSEKEFYHLSTMPKRLHNHIDAHWNLSNKKALFYNLRAYYTAVGKDPF